MTREELNALFTLFGVQNWAQNLEELWSLVQHVQTIPPKRILEIGVQGGYSLKVWEQLAGPEGTVVGVDLGDNTETVSYDKQPTMIIGNSQEASTIAAVKEVLPEIDFLFIDGEHYGDGPRLDWENYSSLVRPGGMVGFHDTRVGEIKAVFDSIPYKKEIYDRQYGIGAVFIPEI